MDDVVKPICWICRNNRADTGEHKIKRSDLRAILGRHAQGGPFYYHDPHRANRIVQSIDAKILKSPVPICADCNNAHTQPHDLAWEWMSNWLRLPRLLCVGDIVRCNKIFSYDTRRQMRNVHLYFLKLFGGMICQEPDKIPIATEPFADAIMKGRVHKEVYLQFGIGDGTIGRSNLECIRTRNDKYVCAVWIHRLGPIAVNAIFAQSGEKWETLDTAWNPARGTRTKKHW